MNPPLSLERPSHETTIFYTETENGFVRETTPFFYPLTPVRSYLYFSHDVLVRRSIISISGFSRSLLPHFIPRVSVRVGLRVTDARAGVLKNRRVVARVRFGVSRSTHRVAFGT